MQAATLGTVSQTLTISGTFAPAQEADLDFSSSGTVTAVRVAVGDKVTKGQVLATIDDTDLKAELASAESTLSSAQDSLESVQDSGTATQIAAAKAAVASDESKVTQAQKSVAAATMTAPFSGTVATVNIAAGDTSGSSSSGGSSGGSAGGASGGGAGAVDASSASSASSSAIVLVDTSSWTVNANVSSADLAQLAKGQSAQVSISTASSSSTGSRGGFGGGGGFAAGGFGGGSGPSSSSSGSGSTGTTTGTALPGTVRSVGIVGSTSTTGTATFPVVVKVSGTESGIYVGTSASVVVTTKSVNNVLTVPTSAISTSNGKSVVTVSKNGSTQQVQVSTGTVYGTRTQVLSGVAAGQMVQVTSRGPGGFGGNRPGGAGATAAAGAR